MCATDSRHDRMRFGRRTWRSLRCTLPLVAGLVFARTAAGQWPIREFQVVSLDDLGISAPGLNLPSIFNAISGQVDTWLFASGLDPVGARLYVPHPETRREIEAYLSKAADVIASWGFPSPRLTALAGKYRVVLAADVPGMSEIRPAGSYHSSFCGIMGGMIFVRASAILVDSDGDGPPRLTPFGRVVLSHELFHAAQFNTEFLSGDCLSADGGSWIVEGAADAVGFDVARILQDKELNDWGKRDYSRRLPVPRELSPFTLPPQAAYSTSSFWRYLAEYYDAMGSGRMPGPEPPGDRVDYRYLVTMLSRGRATGCLGTDAPCDDSLRWLEAGLRSIFGMSLAELYPLFAETLVRYDWHRPMLGGMVEGRWPNEVFGDCPRFGLTPATQAGRERRFVIPRFEPVSMRCWGMYPPAAEIFSFVKVTVEGPPGGVSLFDLSASVSGVPVRVEARQETREPDRWLVSWIVRLQPNEHSYFLLTNVAEDPAASTHMTNLPITFTWLGAAAVVSFDASVSGLDPFNFNPSGEGRHEVSRDRIRFGINGVRTDVPACMFLLNLPTDEGDLVSIGGSLPMPLTAGVFPIEPPDFSRSGPAPVGVLDGQVFRSGGGGRTSAYRGTFRISEISRTHVSGGFDMVAADQPVRASASFVAPLGAPPGGLSPGHPCTPAEPDGTRRPPAGRGGRPAVPPRSAGGEPGAGAPPTPPPGATTGVVDPAARGSGASSGTAAGGQPGAASDPASSGFNIDPTSLVTARRLGTIEGTVDGQPRTWYVVEAMADSGRYASGWSTPQGAGRSTLVVEGFDTEQLPVNSFPSRTAPPAYGPYQGSVIRLTIPIAGDRGTRRLDLAGGAAGAAASYGAAAGAGSYRAVEGAITVEWTASPDGTIRLEGQFSGVFQARNGAGRIRIENGRVHVEGIPPDAQLRP